MTKEERQQKLKEKFFDMRAFDLGYELSLDEVGGIDEAGRGPLAGPVVAACVVPGDGFDVLGIDDSKKLSAKKREELFDEITSKALAYGVGIVDNEIIDEINILQATKRAMAMAAEKADEMLRNRRIAAPDGPKEKSEAGIRLLLLDAVRIEGVEIPQRDIIKGDAKSLSIAAASIIAKVTRDRMMDEYHQQYPYYGFDSNKGYGTKAHYEGIYAHGVTPIHRKTFLKNL